MDLLPRVRYLAPDFVSQMLEAASAKDAGPPIPQAQTLAEPLSDRELEILRS